MGKRRHKGEDVCPGLTPATGLAASPQPSGSRAWRLRAPGPVAGGSLGVGLGPLTPTHHHQPLPQVSAWVCPHSLKDTLVPNPQTSDGAPRPPHSLTLAGSSVSIMANRWQEPFMSRAMIPGDKEKYSAFQGVGGAARRTRPWGPGLQAPGRGGGAGPLSIRGKLVRPLAAFRVAVSFLETSRISPLSFFWQWQLGRS